MVHSYGIYDAGAFPEDADDGSDSGSESDVKYNGGSGTCTSPHDGRLLVQQQYPIPIDELFTMLFTNCKFNVELRRARSVTDFEQLVEWQEQEGGVKSRLMKFTQGLSGMPLGPKEAYVTETQTMNACTKPGALYSIECVSDNAGIPYADYFQVCVHVCMQRVSRTATLLTMYGQIKYRKSTMFKSFIEKNSMLGLYDYCQILETALNAELAARSAGVGKGRARRRNTALAPPELPRPALPPPAGSSGRTSRWLLAALFILLAANALLYYKLHYGESMADFAAYDLQYRLTSMQSAQSSEWLILLERHAKRQKDQVARWREAVHTTVKRLAETERDLTQLLESIKPSLESAQREAEAHIRSGEL